MEKKFSLVEAESSLEGTTSFVLGCDFKCDKSIGSKVHPSRAALRSRTEENRVNV